MSHSVDEKVYALARAWLTHSGWDHDATIMELAVKIQDTIEDFEKDLGKEDERDSQP